MVAVMPAPLIVTGKSSVLPFDVTVPVRANVTVLAPAVTVMPVDTVRLAKDMTTLLQLPENPVKSKLPIALLAVKVTMSEPAVMSISGLTSVTLNVRVPVLPE